MFVELHIIQNFAPSNLNRSDTGSPKDCEFGGYRRARISSQCFKRAIRTFFDANNLLANNRAIRTKRLSEELVKKLVEMGKDADEAQTAVKSALGGSGIKVKDDGKTEYLLFIGTKEVETLATLIMKDTTWTALLSASDQAGDDQSETKKKKKKVDIPKDVKDKVEKILSEHNAVDIALFGRMVADVPAHNVDAACQVAHALSTNKLSAEFDFYTAIDDLNPKEETGAGMMGIVEFNSSCFYRYMNLDLGQLKKNLEGNEKLAKETVAAFIEAAVHAIPTSKQNSMAAQNPPSFLMAVLRHHGVWSLANAFEKPTRPSEKKSLVEASIDALVDYWKKLVGIYGLANDTLVLVTGPDAERAKDKQITPVSTFEDLKTQVCNAVKFAKD